METLGPFKGVHRLYRVIMGIYIYTKTPKLAGCIPAGPQSSEILCPSLGQSASQYVMSSHMLGV